MSRISPQYKLTVLLLLLVALICVSSLLGRYAVRASDVLAACLGWMGLAPTVHGGAQVVMELRLPRIVGAVLVGAALSVSGAAYQVMFRNPMVSPTILGVSAGAAFGAAIAILLEPARPCRAPYDVWRRTARRSNHLCGRGEILPWREHDARDHPLGHHREHTLHVAALDDQIRRRPL